MSETNEATAVPEDERPVPVPEEKPAVPAPPPMPPEMVEEMRLRRDIPGEILRAVWAWKESVKRTLEGREKVGRLVRDFYAGENSDTAPVSEMVKATEIQRAVRFEDEAKTQREAVKSLIEKWSRRPW